MKRVTFITLVMLLLLTFSTSIFAGTVSGYNYVVFEGWSPDWGYNNWGIHSSYYGDVTTYSASKTISKHDVLAYSDVANHDYGLGDYSVNVIAISADSTRLRSYFSLGAINRSYYVKPDSHYYIFNGIAEGTNMSTTKQGNVYVELYFDHDDYMTGGSWTNYLSIYF